MVNQALVSLDLKVTRNTRLILYIYIHINKEDMFGRIARCEAGEAQ
jgi:hypothetical protein